MFDRSRGIPRREFVKSAVAIGGSSALSACADRESTATPDDGPSVPNGSEDLSTLPERQHAWGNYLVHDPHGNTVLPQHQVILFLDYAGDGTPTTTEREQVETAFRTLERAFARGTSGAASTVLNDGLLFMVGYAPAYFDRFDAELPPDIDLPPPETVLEAVGEDAATADHFDAMVLLTSDYGSLVLSAEEALVGNLDRVNGVDVSATLDGVFEVVDRRTGFVGKGRPREELDVAEIPENAPLSMGFKSGFQDNLPAEDKVTIRDGPFAEGTTLMASRLRIDLGEWYDADRETRVKEMFSTEHTVEDVGETGESLGNDSGIHEEMVEDIETHAETHGCVGHSQKTARARDENFEPVILRRSEGVATDTSEDEVVGFNFTSVQREMADFIETRQAMNSPDLDDVVAPEHHGILDVLEVTSRTTFLLPPRRARALPSPRPEQSG